MAAMSPGIAARALAERDGPTMVFGLPNASIDWYLGRWVDAGRLEQDLAAWLAAHEEGTVLTDEWHLERLPAIEEEDTYYHADLIGLAAVTPDGVALGHVTALHNFGAGDLIEIAAPQGGEPLLLPFTDAIVPEIDISAKKIVVVLPSVTE